MSDTEGVNQIAPKWSLIRDFSRTVVSVAVAFLAFTATFVGDSGGVAYTRKLFGSWILAVLATASALVAIATLTNVVNENTDGSPNVTIFFANGSYFLLVLSLGLFLWVAVESASEPDGGDASWASRRARHFLETVQGSDSTDVTLLSLSLNEEKRLWRATYRTGRDTFEVTLNAKTRKVTKFKR
jgi:hypothetical protein